MAFSSVAVNIDESFATITGDQYSSASYIAKIDQILIFMEEVGFFHLNCNASNDLYNQMHQHGINKPMTSYLSVVIG